MEQAAARVANAAKKIEGVAKAPMASIGGAVGAKLGSRRAGRNVGAFLGKITGTGDYRVSMNSIASSSATLSLDSVPQFMKKNSRETRITHREYLGKVTASATAGAFSIQSYAINPGLFATFPWLSQIAGQFDEWRPNGIVVVYKSASSMYSGTSSLGIITMASDYDVLDPTYSNTIEMNNSDFAVSTNVAQNLIHPIECSVKERPNRLLFTRGSDNITTGDSKRFYDLCNFQVATEGCTASQVCGELWITYDISFFKAQINTNPLTINPLYGAYYLDGTFAAATQFGTTVNPHAGNTVDVTFTGSTMSIDNANGALNNRYFLVMMQYVGGTYTSVAQTSPVLTDCVQVNIGYLMNYYKTNATATSSVTCFTQIFAFMVTGPNVTATVDWAAGGIGTTAHADFTIMQTPPVPW